MLYVNLKKSVTEVTGVFLNCQVSNIDRCLFEQLSDDDFDFDESGAIYERGLARLKTIPTYQWGQRCWKIEIESQTSFTVSVTADYIDGATNVPVYRERIYPTEPK